MVTKRDFLALEDWNTEDVERLLTLAARAKSGELTGGLEKRVLGLMLLEAGAGRAAFEIAMHLHGGAAILVEPAGSKVEDDSHLIDTARLHARYCDALAVQARTHTGDWPVARRDLLLKDIAQRCERPVINAGSIRRHPCHALADGMTLRERLGHVEGKRFVLTWTWTPAPYTTAIPVSAALAAAALGMEIVIARPDGYELDPEDTALIRKTAQQSAGKFVHISDDPDDALVGADAVYVSSWGSLKLFDKIDQEREMRSTLNDWRLTRPRLRSSRGGKAVVLHSFPDLGHNGMDDAVLDSPNSAVMDQAENRLHVKRAVLLELLARR